MAYHEAYGLGWQSWSRYDDAIRAVHTTDVAAAAANYLQPDRMVTATVRPPSATPAAMKRSHVPIVRQKPPPRPAKKPRPVRPAGRRNNA
jgi:hypothetical protein